MATFANEQKEFQMKEAAMVEKLAHEKTGLQSELQAKIEAVNQQLHDANERWNSRQSLPKDIEQMKSMQNEIQSLSASENQLRQKMLYFKNELENRETNFNRRFIPADGDGDDLMSPLRVRDDHNIIRKNGARTRKKKVTSSIDDHSNVKPKQETKHTATRRKVRGKNGAGTRKKQAINSSKLPRIVK